MTLPPATTSTAALELALDADIAQDEDSANDDDNAYEADTDVAVNDEDIAHEDVPWNPTDEDTGPSTVNEPVIAALPVNGNPGVAFKANDAVTARDDESAYEDVPTNRPTYDPENEPE